VPEPADRNLLAPDLTTVDTSRPAAEPLAITDDVRARVDQVLREVPHLAVAIATDPAIAASVTWLRHLLGIVDAVLAAEHAPPGVRARVMRAVVFGAVDPDEALQRAADRHLLMERLRRASAPLEVSAEYAEVFRSKWNDRDSELFGKWPTPEE